MTKDEYEWLDRALIQHEYMNMYYGADYRPALLFLAALDRFIVLREIEWGIRL